MTFLEAITDALIPLAPYLALGLLGTAIALVFIIATGGLEEQ